MIFDDTAMIQMLHAAREIVEAVGNGRDILFNNCGGRRKLVNYDSVDEIIREWDFVEDRSTPNRGHVARMAHPHLALLFRSSAAMALAMG